ncbi:MAG: glycosyltransferase family 2 protein [Flavobacteriales bacterium]|nr:glycosyltransferase family 2 protein [Flavobacteriales bacterium]
MSIPTDIELSVVILCYRSEESIIPFAQKTKELITSLSPQSEIVLVGNYWEGSGDRTQQVVEKIAAEDPMFKAICKPKEGMMGWDMRMGLEHASGRYICVIDGDGQFPIESIAHCFEIIKKGEFGLVKTYREQRNDGFYRRLISGGYNLLFKALFSSIRSKDVNSKPKMLTREAYQRLDLHSDDWFIDAEIMIQVGRHRIPFYEFPVVFEELEGRQSFVKIAAIFEFMKNLVAYRFREYGKRK